MQTGFYKTAVEACSCPVVIFGTENGVIERQLVGSVMQADAVDGFRYIALQLLS